MIGIGIDTGGTCTDAVIYDMKSRTILAEGKTLTTKSNLEIGIAKVLDSLPRELLRKADNIALSTTLATNACVENKGYRAKLLIIGTDPSIMERLRPVLADYGINDLSQLIVLDAKAEHMFSEPFDPDWDELRRKTPALFADCDCVGIVQTFPGANGGRFELTALRILQEELTIPLTIAYDICKETDFLKVCASTLLNARLIPLITEFMQAVHHVMQDHHLDIPLMIVRSDGTLMSEEMARTCPVETLLCGPAASVIGGGELSQEENCLILDMGGTTTDIAMVRNAEPVRATEGIMIGQYRTSIKGVDARAISLGGDTAVRFQEKQMFLDTTRIIPVSILASEYPQVLRALEKLSQRERPHTRMIHEFYVLQKEIGSRIGYSDEERRICEALREGPLITLDLVKKLDADLYHIDTKRLEQEGIIMKSGITPTDMMVLKGDLTLYDDTAARLMLSYVAMNLELRPEVIPDMVYEMVIHKMYKNLGAFILDQQYPGRNGYFDPSRTEELLDTCYELARIRCRGGGDAVRTAYDVAAMDLTTTLPLVGIGAPIHVFLPEVAKLFGTRAVLSRYSHVANALGAAAGHRVASVDLVVSADYDGFSLCGFSIVSDCMKHTFEEMEDAVAFASELAEKAVRERAAFQGFGEDPRIEISVEKKILSNGLLVEIYVHARALPRE